jgi:CheY-like chemotaxis protein
MLVEEDSRNTDGSPPDGDPMIISKAARAQAVSSTTPHENDRTTLEHGRLATIGALTAGLGHDLRNAIAPALLRLDTLADAPNLSEGTLRELRAIRRSIGEMQHIAAGLHLLAADPVADAAVPCRTKLSNWWSDLLPLVHAAASPGTLLQADIPTTLGLVSIPPQVLAQVVMALVMNARELMQANASPHLLISARKSGHSLLLTVEHAGHTPSGRRTSHPVDARLVDSPIESMSGLGIVRMRELLRAHDADLVLSEYSSDGGRFEISLSLCDESLETNDQAPVARTTVEAPFSVLCIDDNELLIDALESRLALEAGFSALHRAVPLTDSVAIVARLQPTVVLLDYDLPDGIDALHVLERIVQESPASCVIVFTGFPNSQLVTDAMALGAKGFVSKGIESDRLIAAIHRVRSGEKVIELDA